MKATKKKTPAIDVPVPQSDAEANAAVARIGQLAREVARREADMNDALARIKAECEAAAEPAKREGRDLVAGLQIYCEANRERLTGGRTKTVEWPAGRVSWRGRPPKVALTAKIENVLAALRARGLLQFIRTKEEVDKEAMLGNAILARTVPGVAIASGGEDFVVEPFAAVLVEVRP